MEEGAGLMGWSVEWVGAAVYSIRNRTGSDAYRVRMSLHGSAGVGAGIIRNWSRIFDRIAPDHGPDLLMRPRGTAEFDPPELIIEWVTDEASESPRRHTVNPFD